MAGQQGQHQQEQQGQQGQGRGIGMYGYRAPPPSPTVVHPTLQLPGDANGSSNLPGEEMSAELRAAKQRVLATELATQRETLAGREQLRAQLLQHVKLAERELSETQREARIEAGYLRVAGQRSDLEKQLLEVRWQMQEAQADQAIARGEVQAVAKRIEATQRAQEMFLLQAIGLETQAAAAHERAEQLRMGIGAQRSRNATLVQDLSVLAQPMGANTYLRRKLQELQELQDDLIGQLARHRRDHLQIKRASSRQLMEYAGLTGQRDTAEQIPAPAALPNDLPSMGRPVATSEVYISHPGVRSGGSSSFAGVGDAGQQHSDAYR